MQLLKSLPFILHIEHPRIFNNICKNHNTLPATTKGFIQHKTTSKKMYIQMSLPVY